MYQLNVNIKILICFSDFCHIPSADNENSSKIYIQKKLAKT
jgi:hypothetical protein